MVPVEVVAGVVEVVLSVVLEKLLELDEDDNEVLVDEEMLVLVLVGVLGVVDDVGRVEDVAVGGLSDGKIGSLEDEDAGGVDCVEEAEDLLPAPPAGGGGGGEGEGVGLGAAGSSSLPPKISESESSFCPCRCRLAKIFLRCNSAARA